MSPTRRDLLGIVRFHRFQALTMMTNGYEDWKQSKPFRLAILSFRMGQRLLYAEVTGARK